MLMFLRFVFMLGNFEICSHNCMVEALCIFDNAIPADQIR